MRRRTLVLVFVPFILLGVACQAALGPWQAFTQPPASQASTGTAGLDTPPSSTPRLSPTPVHSQSLTPSPTETPLSTQTTTPTAEPRSSPTPTPTPLPLALQMEVFEDLWKTVGQEYLYPDFNGLDWQAVHQEYRQRINSGLSSFDFYMSMKELIYRLGDDHSAYLTPMEVRAQEAEYAGDKDFVGIGVISLAVPERKRATVLLVFPNSPAEHAGIQIHDSILSINGQPIITEDGYLNDILRGPEGTEINLVVQTPGQEPRTVTVARERINSPMPVPYQVITSPRGKRIGYILLASLADRTIGSQVGKALKAMNAEAPLDGLILDNRENEGGSDAVLKAVLGYFISGKVGYFVSKEETRPLNIIRLNTGESQKLPLVVLVGKGTASFGEISSGILKDMKRAYLIGETSDGNVEILSSYEFADGSLIWLAHETFRPLNHPDQNWEETGIIPDEIIPADWDQYTLETDPAVKAAVGHLEGN